MGEVPVALLLLLAADSGGGAFIVVLVDAATSRRRVVQCCVKGKGSFLEGQPLGPLCGPCVVCCCSRRSAAHGPAASAVAQARLEHSEPRPHSPPAPSLPYYLL